MHNKIPKKYIFLDKYSPKFFEHNNTNLGVIYRNYKNVNKLENLYKISKACKRKKYKLFISNDIKLALKVKAFGIYIPSFIKNKMDYINLNIKNILVIGSAHSEKEINEKIKQRCKAIFLSPIFKNKNNKRLDITRFNLLTLNKNIKFYALGGINKFNIKKLKILNIKGFGAIKFFKQDKKKPA
ncbi:MAG: hypothetical protein CBC24_05200 [Candidatus Pelagibacter sp. TMED64]|nr:thiamine monophosphate synthase [Candidatus Pelagibacter sp.]OUU65522.1 MAG: hypothetical protein CBC24_05200 [Candidatus Pelagibacter sp. TMED64]|tara:strand:+ start:2869 stop:3420 length:552 start_codon:yes stop_codon:yes gene_type:complete